MKFVTNVKSRYSVTAGRTPVEEAALTLLASGVADELYNLVEDPSGKDEDFEYYEKIKGSIEQPQQDIVKLFEITSHDFNLNLKKYLPIKLINEMIKEWETKTGIKFTDMPSQEQHRLPLSCLGHGVTPFDDPEWVEELGLNVKEVSKKWLGGQHKYFENDHNAIWAWLSDAVAYLKKTEG